METFKGKMIEDMVKILTDKEIDKISKKHILDMYCWILTERKASTNGENSKNAKYRGCTYWTKTAFENCYEFNNGKYEAKKGATLKGLKHEHIVPRDVFKKYIKECIYNNQKPDKEKINKYFVGCVVTACEAKKLDAKDFKNKMPENIAFKDISPENKWLRYKYNNIKTIYKIVWEFNKKWNILKVEKINI